MNNIEFHDFREEGRKSRGAKGKKNEKIEAIGERSNFLLSFCLSC